MTDRINHRAEAERLLNDADDWGQQAGEPTPEVGELICLAYSAAHALLAIHDALTDLKPEPATVTHPWSNPLTETHPWPSTGLTHTRGAQWDVADRYALNEAKQREEDEPEMSEAAEWLSRGGSDPLDEDDHRDRIDTDGFIVRRKGHKCWAWPEFDSFHSDATGWPLSSINLSDGPLTFAPEPTPEATGDDLSASEDEGGAGEGLDRAAMEAALRRALAIVEGWEAG